MELEVLHKDVQSKLAGLINTLPGLERREIKRAVSASLLLAWRKGFKEGKLEGEMFSPMAGGEA